MASAYTWDWYWRRAQLSRSIALAYPSRLSDRDPCGSMARAYSHRTSSPPRRRLLDSRPLDSHLSLRALKLWPQTTAMRKQYNNGSVVVALCCQCHRIGVVSYDSSELTQTRFCSAGIAFKKPDRSVKKKPPRAASTRM